MFAKFAKVAATEENPKWTDFIKREDPLYSRSDDPRGEFARDYNRILHCTAYRRLKHKTQVFFATENDHICTRIEHVNHVLSISSTIAKALELNTELTNAIAIGHDVGHAPFGHEGEKVLNEIASNKIGDKFWHEKNSLWFVDNLETLADPQNKQRNLALTYGVRDGIVSHCGEVDQNSILPREDAVDLHRISAPNELQPFTWEACVVKVADKIAFLGRDIEDAMTLGILSHDEFCARSTQLVELIGGTEGAKPGEINNTALIHSFIIDLCKCSSPEFGIRFSTDRLQLMRALKKLSNDLIYDHPRLSYFKKLAKLILESIFDVLSSCYDGRNTLNNIGSKLNPYPLLSHNFSDWITKYTDIDQQVKRKKGYENKIVYDMTNEKDYFRATIDFTSGMTDSFALKLFDELTRLM